MNGRRIKKVLIPCIGLAVLACAGYLALAIYYRNGFAPNTWINGIYCTGKTVEEVNAELVSRTKVTSDVTVVGLSGTGADALECTWVLPLRDMGCRVDYTVNLRQFLAKQKPLLWMKNFGASFGYEVSPDILVDEGMFADWWEQIEGTVASEEDYRIGYAKNRGYFVYDGMYNRLDIQKAYQAVMNAIAAGKTKVDLRDAGCYYDSAMSQEQLRLAALWKQIDFFQSNGPLYDLGDGMWQLDEAQMADFIAKDTAAPYLPVVDANGRLQLAEGAAAGFVEEIADEHDTYGREWEFQSTRGVAFTVPGVTYGTTIDRISETGWLEKYLEGLLDGICPEEQEAHIPEYARDAYNRSCQSIGDTYIEVDMGLQKLYYYEDGELLLETDVVTGNARRRMKTPEGVNFVYSKQKKRVLRGEGYATPVDFWMPVKGAIGIHDADWRKEFGGEIYKTNGSHGCVNVPPDVMARLYDMVEIGTPVVMFYGEETT